MVQIHIQTALWSTDRIVEPEQVEAIVSFYKNNYPDVSITKWAVEVLA